MYSEAIQARNMKRQVPRGPDPLHNNIVSSGHPHIYNKRIRNIKC